MSQSPTEPKNRPTRNQVLLVGLIAVLGYTLDQLTKFWVLNNMSEGETIPVLPPLLNWHFVRNPGAAFSIGTEFTWVFTIIMVIVAGYVIFKLRTTTRTIWLIALGALLGGVFGNLTDRLIQEPGFGVGHVIDFIAFPNFAVFNIADSLIVCSMIGIGLLLVTGTPMNEEEAAKLREEKARSADPNTSNESATHE